MPDSLQHITPTPPVQATEPMQEADMLAAPAAAAAPTGEEQHTPLPSSSVSASSPAAHKAQSGSPAVQKVPADTLLADTLRADSLAAKAQPRKALVLDRPKTDVPPLPASDPNAQGDISSWIMLALLALFLLVAFRFRRNYKYIKSLLQETVDARRRNMFVDTMRETTFSTLLIMLTIAGSGLLLASGVELWRTGAPAAGEFPSGVWVCTGLTGGYYLLQWVAYLFIGHTFVKRSYANRWVQGFKAGVALLGPILLPTALIGTFYPTALPYALLFAVSVYILSRILFILKGIRIFSGHSTYFLLFLYYLCSVEIVPVILLWQAACDYA